MVKLICFLIFLLLNPIRVEAINLRDNANILNYKNISIEVLSGKFNNIYLDVNELANVSSLEEDLKSNIYSIDIKEDGFDSLLKFSFENVNKEKNLSIYQLRDGKIFPMPTIFSEDQIYTKININKLKNLKLFVLKDRAYKAYYRFRNDYYYEALKFSLESYLITENDLSKLGSPAKKEDINKILNLNVDSLSYRDLNYLLKKNRMEKIDLDRLNDYIFENYRERIDFLSDKEILYEDLILIHWKDLCLR